MMHRTAASQILFGYRGNYHLALQKEVVSLSNFPPDKLYHFVSFKRETRR